MTKIELSALTIEHIHYDIIDIRNRLLPVLHQKNTPRSQRDLKKWANILLDELRQSLSVVLPLNKDEIDFITLIRTQGIIKPELITNDKSLAEIIYLHPAVQWATKRLKEK